MDRPSSYRVRYHCFVWYMYQCTSVFMCVSIFGDSVLFSGAFKV